MIKGYYRHPTIFNDKIVFVSEDNLWTVSVAGGIARKITSTNGLIERPKFSPDGKLIAFSGREEGSTEVYIMPAEGGEVKRLTYLAGISHVIGWSPEGEVLFNSAAKNAVRTSELLKVNPLCVHPKPLNLGPATSININKLGWSVIERNSNRPDPAHWKRYRGGTAGQLWTSSKIDGNYKRILQNIKGNFANPKWIGESLFFLSDHEGCGNLYSCDIDGSDLKRHTSHTEYYARNLDSDGKSLVYHSGADIFHFDPLKNKNNKIEIIYHSQRPQRQRKFVEAIKYWENISISPNGKSIVFGSRGQVFSFNSWRGPVYKLGQQDSVRYRLGRWLNEDEIVLVCDHEGIDQIEMYKYGETKPIKIISGNFGNILEMKAAPKRDLVAVVNHRNELIIIDTKKSTFEVVAQNKFDFLAHDGFNWSPDGQWVVYCQNLDKGNKQVRVYNVETKDTKAITRSGIKFESPVFDPNGQFIYFIASEKLNPISSDIMFDLCFIRSKIPCVVPLRKETLSPFITDIAKKDSKKPEVDESKSKLNEKVKVEINFDKIDQRMQWFPIQEGNYSKIIPTRDGKVYYLSNSIQGVQALNFSDSTPAVDKSVKCFDFNLQKEETYLKKVTDFDLTEDGSNQYVRFKNSIQITKSDKKPDLKATRNEYNEKSGWIDFSRIRILIDPAKEWLQMYSEIWRLQRDHFWVESMSEVNWEKIFDVYKPLVERVSCRSEFSDLIWEMQGELSTSHAYEIGGDTKNHPSYPVGSLGADFEFNEKDTYTVKKLYNGELNQIDKMSPLMQAGLNVEVGDELLSIDGVHLDKNNSPDSLLLHKAKLEVELKINHKKGGTKKYAVRVLASDKELRYRDWVETNRHYVHKESQGSLGYVHIPDMSSVGYSEFFRNYLRESYKLGLIVDARYNGGGNVSQLILDYLSRKRIGFDQSRWIGIDPYPAHSPSGPIVALTNQYSGSDGDIFPHAFKLMELGPVIGKRTWGGVIGIYPRNFLVDGGLTTQPEFSFWFKDVGWGVENYGTEPDIEVEITPQDYFQGKDPQLDRGIKEALKLIEVNPPLKPDWKTYPDLSHPKL